MTEIVLRTGHVNRYGPIGSIALLKVKREAEGGLRLMTEVPAAGEQAGYGLNLKLDFMITYPGGWPYAVSVIPNPKHILQSCMVGRVILA